MATHRVETDCHVQVMSIWSPTLLDLVTARINEASNNQESDTSQGDHAAQQLQVLRCHMKSCCSHYCLALRS